MCSFSFGYWLSFSLDSPQVLARVPASSGIRTPRTELNMHLSGGRHSIHQPQVSIWGGGKRSSQVNSEMSPPMMWCQHNDISLWGKRLEGKGKSRGRGKFSLGVSGRKQQQLPAFLTRTFDLNWRHKTELKIASLAQGRHKWSFANQKKYLKFDLCRIFFGYVNNFWGEYE